MTTEHIENMRADDDMIEGVNETALTTADLTASGITATRGQEKESSWSVEDGQLAAALSDYGVSDIKSLLDQLLADESVKKKARRRAVGRVVQNQPHRTTEFKKYDKKNQMVRETIDSSTTSLGLFGTILSLGTILWMAYEHVSGPYDDLDAVLVMSGFFSLTGLFFGFLMWISSPKHKDAYSGRSERTLEEFNKWTMENKKKDLEQRRSQLDQLAQEISSEESTISVSSVKQDYKEVLSRIAEYELDLDKALKYPAFNDVTVPDTRAMIKQLRACSKLADTVGAYNVKEFSNEVDELWVCFRTAEENAREIRLKSVSVEERKLFEQARNLFAHASDETYSEDVRATFYRKLKSVVDSLNEGKRRVPAEIVEQIEAKAAPQIEAPAPKKDEAVSFTMSRREEVTAP